MSILKAFTEALNMKRHIQIKEANSTLNATIQQLLLKRLFLGTDELRWFYNEAF